MTKHKKKLAARIYDAIFPQPAAKRSYAAGKVTRTNADWTTLISTQNYNLRLSLANLRARARAASRDQAHFKKFLSLTRSNIVGPKGIQLQSRARSMDGSLNVALNQKVEDAWWQWGHRETCTVSGRLDWLGVQRLIVSNLACDGEFLVQKMPVDNGFGFSLKVWNVDYLDEMFNETLSNGNRVIMSIEIDDNNRPVAYHLTTPATEINFTKRRERTRTRIPASQMIHGFLSFDDESQVRGVTWFHGALLEGKNYQSYKEGVIDSARMTSHVVGFLEQEMPDGEEYVGAEDDEGNPLTPTIDINRMAMNALPAGWKLNQLDPKQPTQNHPAFSKTILMDVATALDIPYFALAGDMEAVNFSSSRVGLDEARDIWRSLQDFVATAFCREVFHAWLPAAMLAGKLTVSKDEYAEIQNPTWRARGWKYIDPTKDIGAAVTALENNLDTWTDVLGERGIDLTDFLERRKAEIELAKTYGIDLNIAPKTAAPAAEPDDDDAEDEKSDDPPKRELTNGHGVELLN